MLLKSNCSRINCNGDTALSLLIKSGRAAEVNFGSDNFKILFETEFRICGENNNDIIQILS